MEKLSKYKIVIPLVLIALGLIFTFGLNSSSAAPSQQMYVSNTGNDGWSGLAPSWNGTDGPKQTIKNASVAVQNGGTIHIANGTYNENDISVFSKDVNYVGASKLKTIINGNKISRMFTVGAQGVTYSFSFTNMTFMNGNSTAGGALWNYGATTIDNCIFKNNLALYSGGAIYSVGTGSAPASLTITNTSFINNTCNMGGAIINSLSTLSVTGSEFVNNTGTTSVLYNNLGTIASFQFNRFIGTGTLIHSDSGGDLSLNWWGSNNDPSSMVFGVTVVPWLVLTAVANPSTIAQGAKSTVTADLLHDSGILTDPTHPDLYYHDPAFGHVIDGISVAFSATLGTVTPVIGSLINGAASTSFTGTGLGMAAVTSNVDSQNVTNNINVVASSAPVITTTDPANKAVNVPTNKVVKITFNKAIKLGTNPWIEFINSAGTAIKFTTAVSGSVLTLTPSSLLASGTKYSVVLHSGSITDLANTPLAGPVAFSFTTDTPPVITKTDPVNKAVNVPTNKVVKITFSKPIKLGTNPWIEFINSAGTAIKFTTAINSNILSIGPSSKLAANTKYTVILHSGSVTSTGGAGLVGPVGINFTTA